MHSWRFARKTIEDARPAAELDSKFSGSPDAPISQVFGLARIGEVMAAAACKSGAHREIQLRCTPTALMADPAAGAPKPGSIAAEMARGPRDRHALRAAGPTGRCRRAPTRRFSS